MLAGVRASACSAQFEARSETQTSLMSALCAVSEARPCLGFGFLNVCSIVVSRLQSSLIQAEMFESAAVFVLLFKSSWF